MTYVVSDRDLGMDCDFVAKGETSEDVMKKMFAHAQEAHADIFMTLTPEQQDEMSKKLEAAMKEE